MDRSAPHRPHLRRTRAARVHGRDALADRALVSVRPELDHAAARIDHREGGQTVYVYFRQGQRRLREETDGEFCLTQEETGLQFPRNTAPTGTAIPVTQAALDANTVVVKPWWLYRDYQSPTPADRYAPTWQAQSPNFVPVNALLTEPDTTTPTTEIRSAKKKRKLLRWARSTRPTAKRPQRHPSPFR